MKSLILFVVSLAVISSAQALEFRVLSWSGEIRGLKYQDGVQTVELQANEDALSRFYRKNDGTPLVFFREAAVAGNSVRVPVAAPSAPEGMTRGILVLSPRASGDGYDGGWIADDAQAAPPGTLRFLNYTRRSLAVRTSGDQWMQAPGEARRVEFESGRRAVPILVAAEIDDEWRRVVNVSQPVRDGHRLLVLLRDGRPSPGGITSPVELLVLYDR